MDFAVADFTDVALRLVGAFYAFAGFVAARAALTSQFLDRAIAAIALQKPARKDTLQNAWLLCAAVVVLAGGVLLMAGLALAAPLFVLSSVGQAAYLFVVAPRYFDVDDPPDAQGRRQSTNAFVLYMAATAFVLWGAYVGKLAGLAEVPWPVPAIAAGAIAAYIGYLLWQLGKVPAKGPLSSGFAAASEIDDSRRAQCQRIKVMADYECHPLWALDEDVYGDFAPEELGLSTELTADLNAWAEAYSNSLNRDDPAAGPWTEEEDRSHEAEGRRLAVRLKRERPERTIFAFDRNVGVVEVHGNEPI